MSDECWVRMLINGRITREYVTSALTKQINVSDSGRGMSTDVNVGFYIMNTVRFGISMQEGG